MSNSINSQRIQKFQPKSNSVSINSDPNQMLAHHNQHNLVDVDLHKKGPPIHNSEKVKMTFQNIIYEVKILCSKQEEAATGQKYITQRIIKDACGFALPGEVLYIMGASGAGKTSLLNILSDRISSGKGAKVKGKVLLNDTVVLKGATFGAMASYVMQDDVMFKSFSPREALTFAARLKLSNMSEEDQDKRVYDLLVDLNLLAVADVLIGGGKVQALSKSEIKRTAIGVELITDPQLILLDEPTSGLDSFKALSIVRLLRSLARKRGKTVVTTIHQPSSDAFQLFDRLILMCDGYIVYQGLAKYSSQYFKSIGWEVPRHTNPADYYMTVLSISYPKHKVDLKKIKALKKNYDQLLHDLNQAEPKKLALPTPDVESRLTQASAGFGKQFSELLTRSYKEKVRDWAPFKLKMMQMLLLSFLSICLFWKVPRSNFPELIGYIGFVFYGVSIQLFVGILGTVLVYVEEKPLFLREQAGRMYGVIPYYLAKDIIELPIILLLPFMYTCFYLGMATDPSLQQVVYFYIIQVMVTFTTCAYGQVVGSMFDQAEAACFTCPVIIMPFMLFAGFLTNVDTFPPWIGWIQYLSPIRYAFEAGMRNEFEDYHELPIYIPNPMKFLNFRIGFRNCMIMMIITTLAMKVIACFCLKILQKKFQ